MHQHFVKSFNRCYKPGISNLVRMVPRQLRRTRKLLHSLATVDYEISTNRILSVVYPYTVMWLQYNVIMEKVQCHCRNLLLVIQKQ